MQIPDTDASEARRLRILCAVIVAAYAAALVGAAIARTWFFDAEGRPVASDFVGLWSGGRLALDGRGAEAYDWSLLRDVQVAAVGREFDGRFHWPYPPHFLAIFAPFALIAYPWSHLVWMAATIPLYARAVWAILPTWGAVVAALAFPAVFWTFGLGQNGFLAAGLIGGALALLDRRPLLAGLLLGLLTFKPQLGLFVPIALVAAGRWPTIAAAAATTAALVLGSAALFGLDAWLAFARSLGESNRIILVEGAAGYAELISAFGVVRWLGGGLAAALAAQATVALALAAAIFAGWRRQGASDANLALLASATAMASPYAFVYDLVPLAISIAFLARGGLGAAERGWLGVACLLTLGGPLSGAPIAALAAPIVAGVAAMRLLGARTAYSGTTPCRAA